MHKKQSRSEMAISRIPNKTIKKQMDLIRNRGPDSRAHIEQSGPLDARRSRSLEKKIIESRSRSWSCTAVI